MGQEVLRLAGVCGVAVSLVLDILAVATLAFPPALHPSIGI